jgi:hypothetical protein
MKTLLRFVTAAVLVAMALPAEAGDLTLTIADGRVTLVARDVTVREILAEWARVGQTRIVNAEKLVGGPVTLQLENVPEAQALDTLLRSASGYIMAPRSAASSGPSMYDRIMILATSRAPAMAPAAPAAFRNIVPQPQPVIVDTEPDANEVVDFSTPPNAPPNMPPGAGVAIPGQGNQPSQPMTLPRPGMLPAPAPQVPGASPNPANNPMGPIIPGVQPVARPGGGGGGGAD